MAFDTLLQECIKRRVKYGFKPAKTGRKTDVLGEPEKESIFKRFRSIFEYTVPLSTIINDGFIYLLLAGWTGGTMQASADPTAPIVIALGLIFN